MYSIFFFSAIGFFLHWFIQIFYLCTHPHGWYLSSTVFITQLYPAISAFIRLISLHLIIQTGSLNKISRAFPYIAPSFLNTPTAVLQRILISPLTLHSPIYWVSSFTTSSKSVILLLPLTCHSPVSPGLNDILAL